MLLIIFLGNSKVDTDSTNPKKKNQPPNVHGQHQIAKNEKELETIIQAMGIDSEDIGMEFDIGKCAMLIMKSRKQQMIEGIELPN